MASKILTAVAFAYLARAFGPQNYGYLEFTLAIVFIFTLAVDTGLGSYGARELAKDPASTPRLFAYVTLLRALLAVSAMIILVIIGALLNQPWPVKSLIWLYSLTLVLLPGMIQWVFQGHDQMKVVALASILRWSFFAAGIFLLVRSPDQLWIVPFVEFFAIAGAVIFLWSVLLTKNRLPRYPLKIKDALTIYRQALPIGASEMVWAAKIYFATIWLGLIVGGPEVGWFGAAHRIVISLHGFVWLYFYNLLPSIARSTKQPAGTLQQLLHSSIQITAWVSVLIGVFGVVFADLGIGLLYGNQYGQTVAAFKVLIWLIPLAWMSGHCRYTLIGYGQQRLEFFSAVAGAGVCILLNLLLIPTLGILGAAWAIVISEAAIWMMSYVFLRRSVQKVSFFPLLYRPVLTGLLLMGIYYFLAPVNNLLAYICTILFAILALLIVQPWVFALHGSILNRAQDISIHIRPRASDK